MKIRIGLPLPNDVAPLEDCKKSIIALMEANKDHEWDIVEMHSSMIANNRNEIVAYKDMDFDKILFVDGDTGFKPEHFNNLLKSGYPVIAGQYVMRSGEKSGWNYDEKFNKIFPEDNELIARVDCFGTGFCLIDKTVFLLMEAHPEIKVPFYYQWCEEVHMYLTEDVGFCFNCKTCGVPVMIHQGVKVSHWMLTQEESSKI